MESDYTAFNFHGCWIDFAFVDAGAGQFEFEIGVKDDEGRSVLTWTESLSRSKAETLLFQMADVLGWKVGT